MGNVKHLLGISGGKDSAALSIYMSKKYPKLDIEYYTCDTGKELKETYDLIGRLNSVLGRDRRAVVTAVSREPMALKAFGVGLFGTRGVQVTAQLHGMGCGWLDHMPTPPAGPF